MHIVAWNIRHGGGRRIGAIQTELAGHDADIIVLTETRLTPPTLTLCAQLHSLGYVHQHTPGIEQTRNSVLIASKLALVRHSDTSMSPKASHRVLRCSWSGLDIVAVYFPAILTDIVGFYDELTSHAEEWLSRPTLLLGDFNSWAGELDAETKPFRPSKGMQALIAQGWTDAWRHLNPEGREYTWFSNNGNGFRIDVGFLSPTGLSMLVAANYEHGPRLAGGSDHSMLSLELAWPGKPNPTL